MADGAREGLEVIVGEVSRNLIPRPVRGGHSMGRGIGTTLGTTLGISLVALALHLGAASRGYAGTTQGRPAFIVLAVVSAAAAAIALAGRAQAQG